jgi:hypothetical protein
MLILFGGPLVLVHLIPKVAMRVVHRLVLDLIQMPLHLLQIQINSLVGNCPEIRVVNLKTVVTKVYCLVKMQGIVFLADLHRVQTEDHLPSHSHIYHLLLSALYPEVDPRLVDPRLVVVP